MNYKMVGKFISQILLLESAFMLPALFISGFYGEETAVYGYAQAILLILAVSAALYFACRHSQRRFYVREGMVCVAVSWIAISVFGCLPFIFSGEIAGFTDALFEMVSGFSTTGATLVKDVDTLSRGSLYWRSFAQWLGGMGVLVFLLALSPDGGHGSGYTMHLLRAESPGPNVNKLVPKMRTTARILYVIYVVMTAVVFLLLIAGKMPVFDALCTAFSTAGTGGFGVRNDSLAGYSPYIQTVCTVFMFLFGVNFSCYYLVLMRHLRTVFKDEELRWYLILFAASVVLIFCSIRDLYGSWTETLRHAAFQVASVMTTSGFVTTDYSRWPVFAQTILFVLMCTGACAGSTSGGLKVGRLLLIIKNLRRNIRKILNPQRVEVVRLNGNRISEEVLANVNAYVAAYLVLIVGSVLLVSVDGLSMETNISAVVSCFNNIGPAFGSVGPMCDFSGYSWFSKLVFLFDMIAGRLEIFPMLILFSGSTWRHK